MGNKTDLERAVVEEGMHAAEKFGDYFECSVAENPNSIDQVYEILCRRIKNQGEKTMVELNEEEVGMLKKEAEEKFNKLSLEYDENENGSDYLTE